MDNLKIELLATDILKMAEKELHAGNYAAWVELYDNYLMLSKSVEPMVPDHVRSVREADVKSAQLEWVRKNFRPLPKESVEQYINDEPF
jgi:hypothetical protein